MTEPAVTAPAVPGTAASERKWGKLLLALVAFFLLPSIFWFRALLPIENTVFLFVPALAACCLVGWWAGGRVLLAIVWVGLATFLAVGGALPNDAFSNMARGWSLLIAGAFGLVCLFGTAGPFFPRALTALGLALGLAAIMSLVGPVRVSEAKKAVSTELTRRNTETMAELNRYISEHPKLWQQLTTKVPPLTSFPAETERFLKAFSTFGLEVFPALLALESLAALALAWGVYHRLGRARLGFALGALRDFRFNDQLIWGVIVGLTVTFLPTLASMSALGKNLLVFFGALYVVRGLGVLSWFFSPGVVALTLAAVFVLLVWPLTAFRLMAAGMFGVGLIDTWADLRRPPRTTT